VDQEGVENGRWPTLPAKVTLAEGIDLEAEDPAREDDGSRRCVATRLAGGRCPSRPRRDGLLCQAHAGRLPGAIGGEALAKARNQAKTEAAEAALRARMGTRALVAAVFAEKATEVRKTVELLLTKASEGDLRSAQLLLPYLDQALGRPTERTEVLQASSPDDVREMDSAQLQALVALGRERKLRAIGD